jgi:hypothetical protein
MGKKEHGRLVHDLRDALIRRGFEPTCVTQLETPEGLLPCRTPGFNIEKHNDSKSVRLSYRMAKALSAEAISSIDWQSRQALGCVQMKHLVRYNAVLEQEGFIFVAVDSRNPLAPYSLWKRTHE